MAIVAVVTPAAKASAAMVMAVAVAMQALMATAVQLLP